MVRQMLKALATQKEVVENEAVANRKANRTN